MTRLIVVDATAYGPGPSGARRRHDALLARLPALMPDDVFEVHWARDGGEPLAAPQADNVVHARVEVSCRAGWRRWRRRWRQLRDRHRAAPFTHLLTDHGPVVAPDRVRNVVTLHDLRFLHGFAPRWRRVYGRLAYGRVLRRAQVVVAVSDAIGAEARARYGLDPRRTLVVPNAAGDPFRPEPGSARSGALVVARDEPRKARGAAVEAARAAGVPVRVVAGDVDDEALRQHYVSARWLLAPSLYEGFDLPVVEALACGTPVIASDIPAHRDLLARGARGLQLVAPPRREDGGWTWPEAAAALADEPPAEVAPPPWTWEEAARALAAAVDA